MKIIKFCLIFIFSLICFATVAEEKKLENNNTEFSFYTGMFDFSDDGKRSNLVGIQHQNEELNRDTLLGNLSPITGAMITGDNATYIYTGVQAQYKIGSLNFTPSFAPGYYLNGKGLKLGFPLEFRSSAELSYRFKNFSRFGAMFYHLSNASLGYKNPGTECLVFFYGIPLY